jgi:hypothetical protein
MPTGQCPGTTRSNAVCSVCSSPACNSGFYQKLCSLSTDTKCEPYTQCLDGKFLRNRGLTNDGVCQACTRCEDFGLTTLAACSQYADTLCSGTPCSGASPCVNTADRSSFCNWDELGTNQATRTTSGVCGRCPDGYSSDGMYCYECPSTKTCSRTGAVRCTGEVRLGFEPWCYGEYAAPTGAACPVTEVPTRIVTRSTFIQPGGNCAPYFRCKPGYFKRFYTTGQVDCEACETPGRVPANFAWFSDGLSPNDPRSCLYECSGLASWPTGVCTTLPSLSYIPKNAQGQYDAGGGAPSACPTGTTSQLGKAVAESDCKSCQSPLNSLGDPCGSWTCPLGQDKLGDDCYNPFQCPSSMVGYTYATISQRCVPTALPWQKAGYQKISVGQTGVGGVAVALVPSSFSLPENVVSIIPASLWHDKNMILVW